MLTANRLRDGDVLYRKGGGWVLDLADGDVFADQASADAALAAANAELVRNEFVAPYLFEVRETDGKIRAGEGARDHPRRRPHRASPIPASRRPMLNTLIQPPQPNMYRYDEFDAQFVAERVEQFPGQVARRLSGELTEDQFKPLRLMNGLYLQLHAYMLRIAVPYGTLSSQADAQAGAYRAQI